jgi:hypothetical protein
MESRIRTDLVENRIDFHFSIELEENALVLDSDDTLWGLSWSLGRPLHDAGVRQLGLAGSAGWRKCGHSTSEWRA